MGPDPTRVYFWSAVNKRPTCIWSGYFLARPKEILLTRKGKKLKNLIFLDEIFLTQTQTIDGWPDTRTHHYVWAQPIFPYTTVISYLAIPPPSSLCFSYAIIIFIIMNNYELFWKLNCVEKLNTTLSLVGITPFCLQCCLNWEQISTSWFVFHNFLFPPALVKLNWTIFTGTRRVHLPTSTPTPSLSTLPGSQWICPRLKNFYLSTLDNEVDRDKKEKY